MKPNLDLYTDYLLSSFDQTNATGLSRLMEGLFSHDQVTDFLTRSAYDGKALWKEVKPLVRQIEQPNGVLIVDDFVSLLYCVNHIRLPVGLQIVEKRWQSEIKSQKQVWKADTSKNELLRAMLKQAHQNAIDFQYLLGDSWYTNADNINQVLDLGKHYLGAVKSNLEVALSTTDRANGKFIKISEVDLPVGTLKQVYIRSVKQAVVICRDIFINTAEDVQRIRSDGSEGELLLLSTDVKQTYQQIITTYSIRWEVEDYHKSLKNNASLEASPARTSQTQAMHIFAFVKLERLKIKEHLNHFALKARLYLKATKAAFLELHSLKEQLV